MCFWFDFQELSPIHLGKTGAYEKLTEKMWDKTIGLLHQPAARRNDRDTNIIARGNYADDIRKPRDRWRQIHFLVHWGKQLTRLNITWNVGRREAAVSKRRVMRVINDYWHASKLLINLTSMPDDARNVWSFDSKPADFTVRR